MYLSRVRIDLSNKAGMMIACDAYAAHQFIFAAFCDQVAARPLFRMESGITGVSIIVQSRTEPDWDRALRMRDTQAIAETKKYTRPSLEAGRKARFFILANVVKTLDDQNGRTDADGKPKKVRVPLVHEDQKRAWFADQAQKAGFSVLSSVIEKKESIDTIRPGNTSRIILAATAFSGILRIDDGDSLWRSVMEGIGHGKGFGLGLLSIAPITDGV